MQLPLIPFKIHFFALGGMEALRLTVITDLVGVSRVSNAFGMFVTISGFSVIFGGPLAGM